MSHPNEFDPLTEGLFADVASIIAAGLELELPTVAPIFDGAHLLYANRINEIHGEPGQGKTNVATAVSIPVLAIGRSVLYIDPEDSPQSAIRRLLSFGCPPEAIIAGFKHTQCPTPDDYTRLAAWAARMKPQLVVIDGCAEVLAALGYDENSPTDFLKYCRERIKPFTDAGAAVLIADHVIKNAEGRGRWARGTGAKMGKYDGVSYALELGKAYSPTQAGFVRLRVSKDRNGGVGVVGQEVAEIHFTPKDTGGTSVMFRKPSSAAVGGFVPTGLMEKVSRKLEAIPASSKRDLRLLGKSQFVDQAIDELQRGGYISVTNSGAGRATGFQLLKPFREHGDEE